MAARMPDPDAVAAGRAAGRGCHVSRKRARARALLLERVSINRGLIWRGQRPTRSSATRIRAGPDAATQAPAVAGPICDGGAACFVKSAAAAGATTSHNLMLPPPTTRRPLHRSLQQQHVRASVACAPLLLN